MKNPHRKSRLYRFFTDSTTRFGYLTKLGLLNKVSDEKFLSMKFQRYHGRKINLESPQTFNEKLQWLKLYDRKPEYVVMADKYRAREYIAERIGEEYLIPLIGVWDLPDEIDFEKLPDQFVLKCNHNSGLGMCICTDKSRLDIKQTIKDLKRGIREDYYRTGREWPYKDVPRKIIAEQYLKGDAGGLTDYKIHCFNGVPRFILVCRDRFAKSGLTEDFYTPEWEPMDVGRPKIPHAGMPAPRPEALDEMLRLARKLSEEIPFIRIDFYFVEGKVYFSEFTFFPASGFAPYDPPEWDQRFGAWLTLPAK